MVRVGAKSGKQCESGRREREREWGEQARTSSEMDEGRVGVKVVKYGWRGQRAPRGGREADRREGSRSGFGEGEEGAESGEHSRTHEPFCSRLRLCGRLTSSDCVTPALHVCDPRVFFLASPAPRRRLRSLQSPAAPHKQLLLHVYPPCAYPPS